MLRSLTPGDWFCRKCEQQTLYRSDKCNTGFMCVRTDGIRFSMRTTAILKATGEVTELHQGTLKTPL